MWIQPHPPISPRRWSAARRTVVLATILTIACSGQANALSCAVETGAVNFGTYNPRAVAATTSNSGYVDVRCTCSVLDCVIFGYTIEIQGAAANRQMKRTPGGETLNYSLTKDALGLFPFGSGSNGQGVLYLLSLFGSYQRTSVFGSMVAGQSARVGDYKDSPAVVITY